MATNTNNIWWCKPQSPVIVAEDGSPYRHTYYSSQQDFGKTDDVDGNKLVPPIVFAVVIWVLCSRVLAGGRATAGVHVQEGGRVAGGLICGVCLADLEDGVAVRVLPACMHYFHAACIGEWLRGHETCPLCRAPLVGPAAVA